MSKSLGLYFKNEIFNNIIVHNFLVKHKDKIEKCMKEGEIHQYRDLLSIVISLQTRTELPDSIEDDKSAYNLICSTEVNTKLRRDISYKALSPYHHIFYQMIKGSKPIQSLMVLILYIIKMCIMGTDEFEFMDNIEDDEPCDSETDDEY